MTYIFTVLFTLTNRFLFGLFFTSICLHGSVSAQEVKEKSGLTIVLKVPPALTPKDAKIYVAGSFNDWQANASDYQLSLQSDGQYVISLPDKVRGHVEFKFTRGSWDTTEQGLNGTTAENRSFDIPATGAASYSGVVLEWHQAANTIKDLKNELEKILKETRTPGMSVAIVRQNKVEWTEGLGLADVASQRKATADTLFRIGSVSKNFAALAIMKLVNEGKLQLQDPVRKLVPEVWFDNPWETTDPVRVVDLLEHTTGWDDIHFREYAQSGLNLSLMDALNFDHTSRVSRWRPGTRWAYCNAGPVVAAVIVEKISGQKFSDYVQKHFFTPIGMNTATFWQPDASAATTLYRNDGISALPYEHIMFSAAGSINASANDMAAYLIFFLERGKAKEVEVLPAASIDRIEMPTRNWAAQEGVKAGYGLYNYSILNDGIVYHGHDGGVQGGLSSFAYVPGQGVGYFISINRGNGEALSRALWAIRSYVAQEINKPLPPPIAALPVNAASYIGWYQPAAPREEFMHFIERFAGLGHLDIVDGKVRLKSITQQEMSMVPVSGNALREVNQAIANAAFITPNKDGQFVVVEGNTMQRIPTWLVYFELLLLGLFAFSIISTLVYAPVWLLRSLRKQWRRPQELWLKVWPLVATLCFILLIRLLLFPGEDAIALMGKFTIYSLGICIAGICFAGAACVSAVILWRTRYAAMHRFVRWYASLSTFSLLTGAAYLAYWGIIGIRTWA